MQGKNILKWILSMLVVTIVGSFIFAYSVNTLVQCDTKYVRYDNCFLRHKDDFEKTCVLIHDYKTYGYISSCNNSMVTCYISENDHQAYLYNPSTSQIAACYILPTFTIIFAFICVVFLIYISLKSCLSTYHKDYELIKSHPLNDDTEEL